MVKLRDKLLEGRRALELLSEILEEGKEVSSHFEVGGWESGGAAGTSTGVWADWESIGCGSFSTRCWRTGVRVSFLLRCWRAGDERENHQVGVVEASGRVWAMELLGGMLGGRRVLVLLGELLESRKAGNLLGSHCFSWESGGWVISG